MADHNIYGKPLFQLQKILSTDMLKRVTAICVIMSLLIPILSSPASAHSILWVYTSDHTDLVKDEYAAASILMMAVPGVEDASESVECEDGGLEILYEEPGPPELDGVEEEPVQPELTGVEEEPAPVVEEKSDEVVMPEPVVDPVDLDNQSLETAMSNFDWDKYFETTFDNDGQKLQK